MAVVRITQNDDIDGFVEYTIPNNGLAVLTEMIAWIQDHKQNKISGNNPLKPRPVKQKWVINNEFSIWCDPETVERFMFAFAPTGKFTLAHCEKLDIKYTIHISHVQSLSKSHNGVQELYEC